MKTAVERLEVVDEGRLRDSSSSIHGDAGERGRERVAPRRRERARSARRVDMKLRGAGAAAENHCQGKQRSQWAAHCPP